MLLKEIWNIPSRIRLLEKAVYGDLVEVGLMSGVANLIKRMSQLDQKICTEVTSVPVLQHNQLPTRKIDEDGEKIIGPVPVTIIKESSVGNPGIATIKFGEDVYPLYRDDLGTFIRFEHFAMYLDITYVYKKDLKKEGK